MCTAIRRRMGCGAPGRWGNRGSCAWVCWEPSGGAFVLRRRFSDHMTVPAGRLLRGELRPAGQPSVQWGPLRAGAVVFCCLGCAEQCMGHCPRDDLQRRAVSAVWHCPMIRRYRFRWRSSFALPACGIWERKRMWNSGLTKRTGRYSGKTSEKRETSLYQNGPGYAIMNCALHTWGSHVTYAPVFCR